ncbi:SDR family NAD(P)-dependent oxidoreductase, partial [Rhizobium johnstonii]
ASTGAVHALVHIAGGARGADRIEDGAAADWRWMFEVNVVSAQLVTAALLPLLRASITGGGGHADTLFVTSTAAQTAYPGGGGYNAAKAAEAMLV